MALLAAYMQNKAPEETLEAYLDAKVFAAGESTTITADKAEVDGFNAYLTAYKALLQVERAAVDVL